MILRRIIQHPIALVLYAVLVFAVGFTIIFFVKQDTERVVKRSQIAMGTIVEIKVRDMADDEAQHAISAAFAEIRRLDTLFSHSLSASPVTKLNSVGDEVVEVPYELYAMLLRCDTLWRLTGGAFDVAVEALVRSWGFSADAPMLPGDDDLLLARERSGWQHVELLDGSRVRLNAGVGLNFGAVAKGYAVDRAVEVLHTHGVREGLVNAGGDMRPVGGLWKVGIQHPREAHRLLATLALEGVCVATSGDYEQYFEVDGVRYHHIFDPLSGMPARGCSSVSVVADNNTTADAIATAVFVMGPSKGMEFLRSFPNIEGMIVDDHGTVIMTPGFDNYLTR